MRPLGGRPLDLSAGPSKSGVVWYNTFVQSAADEELVQGVRRWWSEHARDLPWRHTRDPWHILVSETMAQQTQVARVIPKWHAFLERFPTASAAASAGPGAIVEMWDGLGYNRRAVQLHACAVALVDEHDGVPPADLDALLRLPGVGPYTARAILAFAFESDVGVLDTNVGRVLARWADAPFAPRAAQDRADVLVPPGAGWEWNQALLDFGATVCTKRSPACDECPVKPWCAWTGQGPDPAVGSAAVSGGQSKFEGSDRQGRGRLVHALRSGTVADAELADVMGWPDDVPRARRVARTLRQDRLAVLTGGVWSLP